MNKKLKMKAFTSVSLMRREGIGGGIYFKER
jgi:hypothetical protein